jgi:hypothetical protein
LKPLLPMQRPWAHSGRTNSRREWRGDLGRARPQRVASRI